MSRLLLLPLVLGLGLWAFRLLRSFLSASATRRATRAAYFDRLAPLFTEIRIRTEPSGFPRIAARHRDHLFDVQAVPDTLTFRKLPALWVMVTLTEPQPLQGETHVMARASGLEPFSTHGQMPFTVALPPGFPAHCSLRTSDPAALPDPAIMARLARLFDDPKLKEIVLSPKGLRIVILAEEADRTAYLLYRDAELGRTPLPAARLEPLLDALCDLSATFSPSSQARPA